MLYYDLESENGEQDRDNAVTVLFKTNVSGIAWKQKILLSSEAVKSFFFHVALNIFVVIALSQCDQAQ